MAAARRGCRCIPTPADFRLFIFLFGGEEAGGGDVAVEDVAEGG